MIIKKDVTKKYRVLGFGSKVPTRVTFIIDKKGEIAWIFTNVDVKQHSKEVLEIIDKIKN